MSLADDIEDYNMPSETRFAYDEIARLKAELAKAQADNARLEAACCKFKFACEQVVSPIRPHWRDTLEAAADAISQYRNPSYFRDLLAPTIDLLDGLLSRVPDNGAWFSKSLIDIELARLRAVMEKPTEQTTK